MYGNHFDDLEQLVECMLLPKLMSINSQNFHFTACNFTERNMYLRYVDIVSLSEQLLKFELQVNLLSFPGTGVMGQVVKVVAVFRL